MLNAAFAFLKVVMLLRFIKSKAYGSPMVDSCYSVRAVLPGLSDTCREGS